MRKLILKIITPEGVMFNEEITSLHVKSTAGDLTILPEHFPLASAVLPSVFHFECKEGIINAFNGQGVLRIGEDTASLIISSFNYKKDIDIERARAALKRANERLDSKADNVDIERAKLSKLRAEARIALWEGH